MIPMVSDTKSVEKKKSGKGRGRENRVHEKREGEEISESNRVLVASTI